MSIVFVNILHCSRLKLIANAVLQGSEEEYTYHFTEGDVTELTTAVNKAKAAGVKTEADVLKVMPPAMHNMCV